MENNINFNDVRTAYVYKNNRELRFTYFIFKVLQQPWLVKSLTRIAGKIVKNDLPFQSLIRNTIFRVFCSGETIREAFDTIGRLGRFRVKSVLDYVSEGEISHEAFDRNRNIILSNIVQLGKEAPGNSISVKLSGLEDPEFFGRINNVNAPRSTNDEHRYQLLLKRLDAICALAHTCDVIVYLDAEDRFMQDVFDHLAELMMSRHNKRTAIVFNTLQMYLRDRPCYLQGLIARSAEGKYFAGIKLVRGAYVEKEKMKALKAGLVSPVYDTKEETDNAFNQAVVTCLRHHQSVHTCIASHNELSTVLALDCIKRFNIGDHYRKVRFSQLFGMSDHLTFNLAASGYNSSKYLPYGELKKAIPYLIRRAEENSSINGQINGEVEILKAELERRRRSRNLPSITN